MLLQSSDLTKILKDNHLLIDLITKLLNDILNDTRELQKGTSIFHCKEIPKISIGDYLKRIYKFAFCSSPVFVISLIYIDRLQEYTEGFYINDYCVHRLLLATIMVAIKYTDDFFYKNAYYAKIGGVTITQMNRLESELLKRLNFNMFISEGELVTYLDRLDAYRDANDAN